VHISQMGQCSLSYDHGVRMDERSFFNLDEASALVGLKSPTLRRAIRHGQLAYAKPGRAYLVRLADVHFWLESELRRGGLKISAQKRAA
jgi:excisionase family DNA binding protein